ncbi:MAG: hypothetical protein KC416_12980, partial [Myxococcales bacterium]|nr:hypothetical protein [Myxococcales bacterium]
MPTTTTLEGTGTEPKRTLRFSNKQETATKLRGTVLMSMEQVRDGVATSAGALPMGLAFGGTVEISPMAENLLAQFKVDRVAPMDLPTGNAIAKANFETVLQEASSVFGLAELRPNGEHTTPTFTSDGRPVLPNGAVGTVAMNLLDALPVVPEEPVGNGANWKTDRTISDHLFNTIPRSDTCTVAAQTSTTTQVKCTQSAEATAHGVELPDGSGRKASAHVTESGEYDLTYG